MQVNGNDIYLIRGDSGFLSVSVIENDTPILFKVGDRIFFTIKTSTETPVKILQKIIEVNADTTDISIEIKPEDTKDLRVKKYFYDIQYNKVSGEVYTIVPPSSFILKPEVTYD